MTDPHAIPHAMTGPEHFLVVEGPDGRQGFRRDMRCDDCRAGKTGDRFTLAIDEGCGVLSCRVCGWLPDVLVDADDVYFKMAPIPVSAAWEHECKYPGETHESEPCDHWSGIVITPQTETSDKEIQS